jgi:nucleolin
VNTLNNQDNRNKVYVGNLDYNVSSDDLKQIFAEAGEVEEAIVITDRRTQRSKGFGFVTFASAEGMQNAIDTFNGKEVDGRELRVDKARPKR